MQNVKMSFLKTRKNNKIFLASYGYYYLRYYFLP